MACYELESAGWYSSLAAVVEISSLVPADVAGVIGTSYIRNLYRRIYPQDLPAETAEADMSPVLLVGRMSVPAQLDAKFNDAYNHERLPLCQRIPGYIRARRFEAVMGSPKYTTVHEMASLDVPKSQAWDDWRTAITPVWNREIRPHMVHEEDRRACIDASFLPREC